MLDSRMTRYGAPLLAVLLGTATALPCQTFTRVIGSGDPVPNGSLPIVALSVPALGGGTVAFVESHGNSTGFASAVFKWDGSAFERVVGSGETAASWTGTVNGFSRMAVDRDGAVAFTASTVPSTSTTYGIFTDQGGILRSVLTSNSSIPGGNGARFSIIANLTLRADDGFIGFTGGGTAGSNNLSGVFTVEPATGSVRTIALEGMTAGGIGVWSGTGLCDVRDGRMVFQASANGSGGPVSGVYVANTDGSGGITKIADTNDINPITGVPYGGFQACQIDEDDVAFGAFEGPFANYGYHPTFAAPIPAGVVLPGVGPAGSLEGFHMDRERLVFEATDGQSPIATSYGLFLSACGSITRILGPGDGLDGKTVSFVNYGDEAMDGDSIALLVGFTDNTHAIYLADLSGFDNYGSGLSGELGLTPRIAGFECPAVGTTFHVELRDGPSLLSGSLFAGLTAANIPIAGGIVLTQPVLVGAVTLQPSAPGLPRPWASLPLTVPNDPSVRGTVLFLQALYPDPQAPQGVSMSDGLRLTIE